MQTINKEDDLKTSIKKYVTKYTGLLFLAASFFSIAQENSENINNKDTDVELFLVTGSYIAGAAEDTALPIDILNRQDLDNFGSPTMIEMVRNLGVTSGNIGESNQFQNGPIEGVATVNLRGLGSARTLVLLNGRRHVATETLGVDISAMPTTALGRVEILKDGAAALYGSDAIGGVVNFITRSYFDGFEVRVSNQFIEDSDGDQNIAAIFGSQSDDYDFMIAAEYEQRGELKVRDRDWALQPFEDNPDGGWSSIGNPGRVLPAFNLGAGPQPIGAGGPDPQCELLGGAAIGTDCRFQFLFFNNLIEKQKTSKIFAELNFDINDDMLFHVEGLYAFVDLPQIASSPTFPPQSLFGADRYISPTHPGLIDFKTLHPELFPLAFGQIPGAIQGAFAVTRLLGVAGRNGGASLGIRERHTARIASSLSGSLLDDSVDFEIAMSLSQRRRLRTGEDSFVERTAFSFDGLGGPNCDPALGTPGVGPCEYYNPFSNSIEFSAVNGVTNPEYNPAVANSPELLEWLIAKPESSSKSWLATVDAVFNGVSGIELDGGEIKWAAGAQVRRERYKLILPDLLDRAITPCPFNNPMSVSLGNTTTLDCAAQVGQLAFLASTDTESTSRNIYSVFAEFAVPISDAVEMQSAIRYENYGGATGSSIDPKIAVSWKTNDWLQFRASASTTFRGPPQSLLTGTDTNLAFIPPALAFKAVDSLGNPDLKAESAFASNLGLIINQGEFHASLDWFRFDISDPFQLESANKILEAYISGGCEADGTGEGSSSCDILRTHIFPFATPAAGLERLEVNQFNGSDQLNSGLDIIVNYNIKEVLGGTLSFDLEATKILKFESEEFRDINGLVLSPGGDFSGFLNDGDPFTPMPELKGNFYTKFAMDNHHFTYAIRYISDYVDARPSIPGLARIDSQVTHDIHYNVDLFDAAKLSFSVINLTDEDPPSASTNLNYDAFTHNAFGRLVKVGLVYRL
jgi:iron complex outermembrane receptor protein